MNDKEATAIKLLEAFQTHLGASRCRCDEDERETWDSIDNAIREIVRDKQEIEHLRAQAMPEAKQTRSKPDEGTSTIVSNDKIKAVRMDGKWVNVKEVEGMVLMPKEPTEEVK